MKKQLIDALEICLQSLDAGIPLDECSKRSPEYADELRDLLLTAEKVKRLSVDKIPADPMRLSEGKVLLQASVYKNTKRPAHQSLISRIKSTLFQYLDSLRILRPITGKLVLAVSFAALLIVISGGLIKTSAKSLPGEALYPVKRAVEDITIYLALNGEIRHDYEDSYSEQRVEEVNMLFTMSREQKISFEGIVSAIDGNQWNVSGVQVFVQPDTVIITGTEQVSLIKPGMRVEVEGETTKQGHVLADEIHLREYEITGSVETIDVHDWQISGITINIPSYIHIDGGIRIGDEVSILIRSDDDGLYALAIQKNGYLQTLQQNIKPRM
jgi:hypothetical protein